MARLWTIPAVGEKTANRMAAVLGANTFASAKEAAAFLGLVPVKVESGVSVKGRAHLSKAENPRVRASLYMAAVVAKKGNPEIKALYERLCAQGKPRMSALGACMRKLVHLCFGVLKSGKDYAPPEERNIASTWRSRRYLYRYRCCAWPLSLICLAVRLLAGVCSPTCKPAWLVHVLSLVVVLAYGIPIAIPICISPKAKP